MSVPEPAPNQGVQLTASRFRQQLTPGVGGAADKAAYLMGCKSPYRQLPDADGEHIRGAGR